MEQRMTTNSYHQPKIEQQMTNSYHQPKIAKTNDNKRSPQFNYGTTNDNQQLPSTKGWIIQMSLNEWQQTAKDWTASDNQR